MQLQIQKIIDNKSIIINDSIEWQKNNHPRRTDNYNKCIRDINFVLDAYISDLSSNTTSNIRYIGSKYWVGVKRQIQNHETELAVHHFIVDYISKNIVDDNEVIIKLSALKDILIHIINNGSTMNFDSIMEKRKTNFSWSQQTVDKVLIKHIIETVIDSVPSKQNKFPYTIDVLDWSDPALRNDIFFHTHRDINESVKTDPGNPQTLAPMLLVFTHRNMSNEDIGKQTELHEEEYKENIGNLEIGIVSTMLMLSFENVGLATGFCQCINDKSVLGKKLNRDKVVLMMGVGYPSDASTYFDPRINAQKNIPNFHNPKPPIEKIVNYRFGK